MSTKHFLIPLLEGISCTAPLYDFLGYINILKSALHYFVYRCKLLTLPEDDPERVETKAAHVKRC